MYLKRSYPPLHIKLSEVDDIQNSLYSDEIDGQYYLYLKFIKPVEHISESFSLGRITSDEMWVNRGRFKNFSEEWWYSRITDTTVFNATSNNEYFTWIGENIVGQWSFRLLKTTYVDFFRGRKLHMRFSFETDVDAMHFALRWR